jgi:hypothetical protein
MQMPAYTHPHRKERVQALFLRSNPNPSETVFGFLCVCVLDEAISPIFLLKADARFWKVSWSEILALVVCHDRGRWRVRLDSLCWNTMR